MSDTIEPICEACPLDAMVQEQMRQLTSRAAEITRLRATIAGLEGERDAKKLEKRAPVQDRTGVVTSIPWEMHLRAYAAYCKQWSPQPAMIDLEGRNCRGGFSTGELDGFIPGWRAELSDLQSALARVAELEEERLAPDGQPWRDYAAEMTGQIMAKDQDAEDLKARVERLEMGLKAVLAFEAESAKFQGLKDCRCINHSRETDRAYESGRCAHQLARSLLSTGEGEP